MIYRLLDRPLVYRAAQAILSPGGDAALRAIVGEAVAALPPAASILDVGCGPRSLIGAGFGLDLSPSYVAAFPGRAAVGSAATLPFADGAFDAAVSFGLLHHLADADAAAALGEMRRVARRWALVTDPVLPSPARPLPWAIRKLDRGGRVRAEPALRALLAGWTFRRFRYGGNGLEGALATALAP